MKSLVEIHPWKLIDRDFNPSKQKQAESLFSIGNGSFGQRANFEEDYSGPSLQGSYIGGVYYPDKTRVGWWKNGYPDYFAKVLNSANWIGLHLRVNGFVLDAFTLPITNFYRELDLKSGLLTRKLTYTLADSTQISITALRFCSMANEHLACTQFSITTNRPCSVEIEAYVDGKVKNHDANYDEYFWQPLRADASQNHLELEQKTKKTEFHVAYSLDQAWTVINGIESDTPSTSKTNEFAAEKRTFNLQMNGEISLTRFVGISSSLSDEGDNLLDIAKQHSSNAQIQGWEASLNAHILAWDSIWHMADVVIDGDNAAQQGIRFNIFQLFQTYTGKNPKLNIGPKGFTGEKYGGATYWDTEAYCIPFYLKVAEPEVARQLLLYRFQHLDKAIENAAKLGFKEGAALFPMVTMNGEECHNEWEITFEEIHRNGAIVYAIYLYEKYTGDASYVLNYGYQVVFAVARFWAQRVNWSNDKKQFVILGVTGPNEYENNVNNNWYTNYLAAWCLKYGIEIANRISDLEHKPLPVELQEWAHIANNMYLGCIPNSDIFLQNDGFLDKIQSLASEIPVNQRPINQHWSWDRILRSVFIKQADVLQGLYFFENHFTTETIRANFEFYEPRTVHESSLSPCVHSILASWLGKSEKALEMYLRTARLDLDDYNHEADEGLHITSMAGTFNSVVEGFAGLKLTEDGISLEPRIPLHWNALKFNLNYRGARMQFEIFQDEIWASMHGKSSLTIQVFKEMLVIKEGEKRKISTSNIASNLN